MILWSSRQQWTLASVVTKVVADDQLGNDDHQVVVVVIVEQVQPGEEKQLGCSGTRVSEVGGARPGRARGARLGAASRGEGPGGLVARWPRWQVVRWGTRLPGDQMARWPGFRRRGDTPGSCRCGPRHLDNQGEIILTNSQSRVLQQPQHWFAGWLSSPAAVPLLMCWLGLGLNPTNSVPSQAILSCSWYDSYSDSIVILVFNKNSNI